MEAKEIDGKMYIEYDQHKTNTRRFIMQIVFLIVIIGSSYVMANTIGVLVENSEVIKNDPLIYGMGVHNFTSCQCIDVDGKDWRSVEGGFLYTEFGDNFINYSSRELEPGIFKLKEGINGTGRDS